MEKKDFGARLLSLRKEKGVSQADVAEYIGLTVAAYQNYENGRREAGYDTISKLADFYGVTTDYLLGRPEAEPPADPFDNLQTVEEMEADLMHRWLGLSPKAREAFLQVLRDIVHEDDKRKQAKESEKNDTDYITVSTTLGEIEDRMKADKEAKSKDA